jgi:hypothetical protein
MKFSCIVLVLRPPVIMRVADIKEWMGKAVLLWKADIHIL